MVDEIQRLKARKQEKRKLKPLAGFESGQVDVAGYVFKKPARPEGQREFVQRVSRKEGLSLRRKRTRRGACAAKQVTRI